MGLLAEGDNDAFAALVREYQPMMVRLAGRFVGCREDAEDAVQEAVLAAFQQRRRFRGECSFSTWLGRIAIYQALKLTKRRTREQDTRDSSDTETSAASAEDAVLVRAAVMGLPEKLRVPVVLRFYEGLDGEEIASLLGCKPSTVWTWLYRGLEKLRRELGEGDGR
ncbi:MAG: RNA polymerase sigma factor [Armatimonadia bacterium]